MQEELVYYHGVAIERQEYTVLQDVNFSLRRGDLVYALGNVGSGKSSFLKTMYAELAIKKGDAQVLGYDLAKLSRSRIPYLRRKIGIVFQDYQLLADRSVDDNLRFVLTATEWRDKEKIRQRIEQVLTQVGMQHKGYKMPHELSGGEQQRIVIARALLNDPQIILADEPTGNLDPQTSLKIMELLYQIAQSGTAVIVATHNHTLQDTFPGRVIRFANYRLIDEKNEEVEEI